MGKSIETSRKHPGAGDKSVTSKAPLNLSPVAQSPLATAVKLSLVVLLGGAMIGLVLAHVPNINGPPYWRWPWRRLHAWPLLLLMAAASAPLFLGQWLHERRTKRWLAIGLVMLSSFAFQMAATSQQFGGMGRIAEIVNDRIITSYFTIARTQVELNDQGKSLSSWLEIWPELMAQFPSHGQLKPPGLMLFHVAVIHAFGSGVVGQTMGGLLIAALATLAVPGTYLLIRLLASDERAAFAGASFMGLCPSLVVFCPMFDQTYPAVACAMVLAWSCAVKKQSTAWAMAFGVVLMLATFMSYILLVPGFFLATWTLLHARRYDAAHWIRLGLLSLLAIGTVGALYATLYAATGFDPIGTFHTASYFAERSLIALARPFPKHMAWDVYDFALGSGWISFLLAGFALMHRFASFSPDARRLILLGLGQVAVMASAAILPGEASRLWMLLYPFLMIAVGFELSRWPMPARLTVYALLVLITTVIVQNMLFMNLPQPPNWPN